MGDKKTILIIAPYWRQVGHVGNYRVDRYSRWLSEAGYNIVIVRAGSRDNVETTKLGYEITIRDPLKLYPDAETQRKRKPNRYRRMLALLLLNPDPSIIWVRRVVKHPLVEQHGRDVVCLLSSSPPESIHVASSQLARQLGTKLWIDMRDGWLDEPLKPLLQQYKLQRWREARLEKRVLAQADKIIVTSNIWKQLLGRRLAFTNDKTVVVTNGYPLIALDPIDTKEVDPRTLRLVHAGRFTSSRYIRKPSYMLELLDRAMEQFGGRGIMTLLGDLDSEERREIESWNSSFQDKGWTLEFERSVSQEQMLRILQQADGLLLLSVARAAIPIKLFEYILVQKPILAVTGEGSAVWRVGANVPQMFLADYKTRLESVRVVTRFLEACMTGDYPLNTPDIYSEGYLKNVFMNEIVTDIDVTRATH